MLKSCSRNATAADRAVMREKESRQRLRERDSYIESEREEAMELEQAREMACAALRWVLHAIKL